MISVLLVPGALTPGFTAVDDKLSKLSVACQSAVLWFSPVKVTVSFLHQTCLLQCSTADIQNKVFWEVVLSI